MNKFKDRLSEAMRSKGYSQSELARRSGVGRNSISDYLKGKYEAKQDKIYLLAKALNVDEAWLMGMNTDKERKAKGQSFETIAAHLEGQLTDEEWDDVLRYAEFLKAQREK